MNSSNNRPSETTKRDTFEFIPKNVNQVSWDVPDGSMEVTSGPHGVTFEVTDECAVDSYNSEFTCGALLPRSEAERLRDWLIDVLS